MPALPATLGRAAALSLAFVAPAAAQTGPPSWTLFAGVGEVIQTQFGPFPTSPVGFCTALWNDDGDPATPSVGLLGGSFASVAVTGSQNIARRAPDGTWQPIGPGLPFAVTAMTGRDDGTLIAGGYVDDIVTFMRLPRLSVWDGSQWMALPAPDPNTPSNVAFIEDIALDGPSSFVIGGAFDSVAGVASPGVARWDGTSWSALGAGLQGGVRRVAAVGGGEFVAAVLAPGGGPAGASGFARWNGSSWVPAFVGAGTSCLGVTDFEFSSTGTLYASGIFVIPGANPVEQVARWNGQDWERLGAGIDETVGGVVRIDLLPGGDVVAAGFFGLNSGSGVVRVARFDGSTWSRIDQGLPFASNGQVLGVTTLPGGEIVAAGAYELSTTGIPLVDTVVAVSSPLGGPAAIGTSFCNANSNSTGVPGVLTATGSTLVADNDVTLTISSAPPGQFGIFAVAAMGSAQATVNQGVLCLSGDVGRYNQPGQIFLIDGAGGAAAAIDLTQVPTSSSFVATAPGDTWFFQAWHRDTPPAPGAPGSNFTAGVQVTFN